MDTTCNTVHSPAPRLLYDRREASRQLSISVRSLDYAISRKKIGTRRKGKKVLIPHTELARYAAHNDYEPLVPASPVKGDPN
jgi:hypothetical protein